MSRAVSAGPPVPVQCRVGQGRTGSAVPPAPPRPRRLRMSVKPRRRRADRRRPADRRRHGDVPTSRRASGGSASALHARRRRPDRPSDRQKAGFERPLPTRTATRTCVAAHVAPRHRGPARGAGIRFLRFVPTRRRRRPNVCPCRRWCEDAQSVRMGSRRNGHNLPVPSVHGRCRPLRHVLL